MNYLSSRQVYAAAKVVGCIGAIPLSILILRIPYASVLFTVAFTILTLWAHRSELSYNSFQDTLDGVITGSVPPICASEFLVNNYKSFKDNLVGLTTGIAPMVCVVSYPTFLSLFKESDNITLIEVMAANLMSIIFGGMVLFIILCIVYIIKLLFNHFMKGCSDNKESDVFVTNDPGSQKTEKDGMTT